MSLGLDKYERNNKKSNYLDKDPNILYYNENSKKKSPIIGLLKKWKFISFKVNYN